MASPSNHLKGYGCPICHKIEGRRSDINQLIAKANQIHQNKYDYSLVEYKNSKTPVKIICPVHGVFEQTMEKHVGRAHGCPMCAKNCKDTTASFIEKARKVHGDYFDYSKVQYVNQHMKVCIIDPQYGEFWEQPNAHLNGRKGMVGRADRINATKKARHTFHTSSTEKKVYGYLIEKFGEADVVYQYKSEVYPFWCDFYIKSLDLYIEMNVYFSHGGHFFDFSNDVDVAKLQKWKSKSRVSDLYKTAVNTWTISDVKKRQVAMNNHLNYLVFWKYDLSDFLEWYDNFDERHILCNVA